MQFCGRLSFMFAIQIIIKTGKIYNNAKFYDIMLLTKENAEKEADKIGKIEYQPNVTFTSAEIDKLDDTEYSNKTRTPFYDLRRCAVNVSPDGKKMLMFKQSRQGNVQYSFYDFNAIKKALDSNSTNDRSFRYNDKLAEACDSDVINADNVPNGQLQGIAIDNDLNIYIPVLMGKITIIAEKLFL